MASLVYKLRPLTNTFQGLGLRNLSSKSNVKLCQNRPGKKLSTSPFSNMIVNFVANTLIFYNLDCMNFFKTTLVSRIAIVESSSGLRPGQLVQL